MSRFLLVSSIAFGVQAFYPYNEQTPVILKAAPAFTVLLESNNYRDFHFQSTSSSATTLSLNVLHQIAGYDVTNFQPTVISIDIPLDITAPASMSIGTMSVNPISDEQDQMPWIETLRPGEDIPLSHVGIRRGGMYSIEVQTARLALETPYISIPKEIFDALLIATQPVFNFSGSKSEQGKVDCDSRSQFPDLVLGLELESGDNDEPSMEINEILITPEQYIMESEQGTCILLVRSSSHSRSEEVVLGWAAIRGREIILDWVNLRTSFEW